MIADKVFAQGHTETGSLRQSEVAINHLGIVVHRSLNPGISEVTEVLLDPASALARLTSDNNFERICLYLNRLPTEFQVLCARDPSISCPEIRCSAAQTK